MDILDTYAVSTEGTAIRADLSAPTGMGLVLRAKVTLYVAGSGHQFLSVEQASILVAQLTNAVAQAQSINERNSGKIRTLRPAINSTDPAHPFTLV